MNSKTIYVSGYYRRQKDGRSHYVRCHTSERDTDGHISLGERQRHCPSCGTPIRTRGMKNGRPVTFEAREGLTSVKHPCSHLGEHLRVAKDTETFDLFDYASSPHPEQGNTLRQRVDSSRVECQL